MLKYYDVIHDGYLSEGEILAVKSIEIYSHNKNKLVSDLTGIEYFTALETLDCDQHLLTSIDLSKNTALKKIQISSNDLTSLDVSNCTALEELYCSSNKITKLDVSMCN